MFLYWTIPETDNKEIRRRCGMTDKQVETFIIENVNWFCSPEHQMIGHRIKAGIPSEGEDGTGFSIDGNGGHIEVKTIRNFLTRGNDNYEPTGSIPFEVFLLQSKKDIEKAIAEGRDPDFPGWLFNIFNHLIYMDRKAEAGYTNTTASAFDKLAYVLRDSEEKLFACIMFDDIPRLRRCLEMILPPMAKDPITNKREWDIANVRIPKRNDRYWSKYRRWDNSTGGMILNMWHIPFYQLLPLATVTMIDADPQILQDHENTYGQLITAEMQRNRLNTLKNIALYPDGSERRIYIEEIRRKDPRHRYIDLSVFAKRGYAV